MSLNHELAELFNRMAAVMEIKGEIVFKSLAFRKMARVLKDMSLDVREACEKGKLADIDGCGKSCQKVIEDYVKTGKSTDYDELVSSVPAGLLPMLEISGLGPKTIALFWKEKKITSIEELLKAIEGGKLAGLKGIGEKKLASIKEGIAFHGKSAGRIGIGEALPVAQALLEQVRKIPGVGHAEIAGSLRRGRETIGDVDLIACADDAAAGQAISSRFVKFPEVDRILGQGHTKASVTTKEGIQVDLRIVPSVNFGAALLYFTGSKEHNVLLRSRAQGMELTLNEWGLYKISEYDKAAKKTGEAPGARPVASKSEEEIYAKLGLPPIEPELREDRGEIDAALAGKLPRLIRRDDLRGDLHTHTSASDGGASIEEMAAAAVELGYEYLAITDHSKSSVIANGLTAERLLKHVKAIHQAGETIKGIKLLAGCEVDILADGALDFEDAILAELDIVVASPHVALKQDAKKSTERILRAIDNRYVNIIGHPTGRMINSREGLPLDFSRIIPAAAANGIALEINAGYPRLDLNEQNARAAVAGGVMLAIDTDAHSTAGLSAIGLGLTVARRAWVEAKNVVNCLPFAKLRDFLARKRGRAA